MYFALAVSSALAISQAGQNPGSAMISKMLAYYHGAKTVSGTIDLTASDGTGNVQVSTKLQFSMPSKLYLFQHKGEPGPMDWLVASDGKSFSYDTPGNFQLASRQRLTESVSQAMDAGPNSQKRDYNIGQIYAVVARSSIGDRSIPLDVAIGRREDLLHDKETWMTIQMGGIIDLGGKKAHLVFGKWREYGDQVSDPRYAPGDYEIAITDEGQLLRYTITEIIGDKSGRQVQLTEVWKVNLKVNGPIDEGLFRLP